MNPYGSCNNPLMPHPNTTYAPTLMRPVWQEVAPGYYALSWGDDFRLYFPGGYTGNPTTWTPTPMPPLPPFLNEFASSPTSPATSIPTMTLSDHGSDSDSSTEWGRSPLIPMALTMSGPSLPSLTEKSSALPEVKPRTSDEEMSKPVPSATFPGPDMPIGTDPYSPPHRGAEFMGFTPAPPTSNPHWNNPLPTSWTGSNPHNTAQGVEPPFHFNQQTFGDAIRDAGDNP